KAIMKIIVYNYKDQYALSRKQLEKLIEVLPNKYFAPIQEFHITYSRRGSERFEYVQEYKQAHFCYPVEQKNNEIVSDAVRELLIGLARMKTSTMWGYKLSENERSLYQDFLDKWHSKCMSSLMKPKP
ncbi:hypothetical protein, partial [Desulfatiferula olefinivorans]